MDLDNNVNSIHSDSNSFTVTCTSTKCPERVNHACPTLVTHTKKEKKTQSTVF